MARGIVAVLLTCLALAAPAGAGEAGRPAVDRLEAVYDFYVGGIWAGVMKLDADFGATDYRARVVARTAGLVGFFFPVGVKAEAIGRVGDDGLTPDRFTANAYEYRRRQSVEITYDRGTPSAVRADPPYRERRWSIRPEDQTGIADPLSASYEALAPAPREAICNRTAVIFDGERRWAIEIGPPQPPGRDGRVRCDAAYLRLAGFKPSLAKRRPFAIYLEDRGDGLYQVVRVAGKTSFGLAVLLLRD